MPNTDPADFTLADHGSIWLLHAITPEARTWVNTYLPEDFSGAIEARYVGDIIGHINNEGMIVR